MISDAIVRMDENIASDQGVEFDIIVGLMPVCYSYSSMLSKWYWIEQDGFVHFADTKEQAEWDRREYILEVLSA